jgi:hypothetical protein
MGAVDQRAAQVGVAILGNQSVIDARDAAFGKEFGTLEGEDEMPAR